MSTKLVRVVDDEDEAFLRTLTRPEEDRHKRTGAKWNGGYRYFRAPNVLCFENFKRVGEP
jgi:hypothetical protein